MSLHCQASLGLGITNVMQSIVEGAQGTTSPSLADFTKQAVLNRVPFGSSGWIVTDSNGQAKLVRYLFLKVPFPHTGTMAIATTTIRFDHQMSSIWEVFQPFNLAPADNVIDRKGGCIC
jgi:hypothetical protein